MIFFGFFWIFWDFWIFLFLNLLDFLLDFCCSFGIPFKVTKFTTKGNKVTTGHCQKMSQNSTISSLFSRKKLLA